MNPLEGKYAWSVSVGTKGQIVIPKEARDLFGIRPGDTILLLADVKRGIAIPPKETLTTLYAAAFRGAMPGSPEPVVPAGTEYDIPKED